MLFRANLFAGGSCSSEEARHELRRPRFRCYDQEETRDGHQHACAENQPFRYHVFVTNLEGRKCHSASSPLVLHMRSFCTFSGISSEPLELTTYSRLVQC